VTFRDPIDPAGFPVTAPHWDRCRRGAQRAGLIRLEALYLLGGVYVDSDVEPYRPLDSLLGLPAFAAWEDAKVVPDAVLGAEPVHPAIGECLVKAIERIAQGPWASGPGVTTEVLPGRADVLLLPPGSFYEVHYKQKDRLDQPPKPWEFARHHWHASWLPKGG